jgi:hypothetical protein
MKILPRETLPPDVRITRRHKPKATAKYQRYRSCLRWDFGFTCSFCLLHEADLNRPPLDSDRSGLTTIEHLLLQTEGEGKDSYENLVYACWFCNRSRSTSPLIAGGVRLLNPTEDVWRDHFVRSGDQLLPSENDPEAAYTERTYHLNDPLKVAARRKRRELIDHHLQWIREGPPLERTLLEIAERTTGGERDRLVHQAALIRREITLALADLESLALVPSNAPSRCRCETIDPQMPEGLAKQFVQIPDPA